MTTITTTLAERDARQEALRLEGRKLSEIVSDVLRVPMNELTQLQYAAQQDVDAAELAFYEAEADVNTHLPDTFEAAYLRAEVALNTLALVTMTALAFRDRNDKRLLRLGSFPGITVRRV